MKRPLFLLPCLLLTAPWGHAQQPTDDPSVAVNFILKRVRAVTDRTIGEVETQVAEAEKAGKLTADEAKQQRALLAEMKTENLERLVDLALVTPAIRPVQELRALSQTWEQLRTSAENIKYDTNTERIAALQILNDALAEAAQTAEKPEDLNHVMQLVEAYRKLPDFSPLTALSPAPGGELLRKNLAAMKAALGLRGKGTGAQLREALDGMEAGTDSRESPAGPLVFDVSPKTVQTFRLRMAESQQAVVRTATKAVESSIMAGAPPAKSEELIGALEREMRDLDSIENGKRTESGSQPPAKFAELPGAFREVVRMQRWMAGENILAATDPRNARDGTDFGIKIPTLGKGQVAGMSPEFSAFVDGLKVRLPELAAKAEVERKKRLVEWEAANRDRLEKEKEEQRKSIAEEEQAAQAKAVAQLQESLARTRDKVRAQIRAARTPQELITLSETLPAYFAPRPNEQGITRANENWQALQAELQSIAGWWIDSTAYPERISERNSASVYAAEMKEVRERAARDVYAARLSAPQLNQPPLSELPARQAVQKLSEEAAEKGNWEQSYEILRELSPANVYPSMNISSTTVLTERQTAIKAYLAGRNLEAAGQYRDAIASYRQVFIQVGRFLPTREAGERLNELEKKYPDLFREPPVAVRR